MRDPINQNENEHCDGTSTDAINPPHRDDLRTIMQDRETRIRSETPSGEFSSEVQPKTETAWPDAEPEPPRDVAPWQGRVPEPEPEREYDRPPFYSDVDAIEDDRHPPALARFGPPAGFGRRLAAYMIDNAISLVILSLLFPILIGRPYVDVDGILSEIDVAGSENTALPTATPVLGFDDEGTQSAAPSTTTGQQQSLNETLAGLLLAFGVTTIYNTILVGIWGTTVGKRALNVYVLDGDGNIMGIPMAFARALATIVSTLIFYVGYVFIAFRADHRALHDLLAGTYAVTLTTGEVPRMRPESNED